MIARLMATLSLVGFIAGSLSASALTVDGTVYDSAGAKVSSAKVWIVHERGIRSGETSDAGAFSFEDLSPGEIDLVIYKEGFALGGATGPLTDDASLEIALLPAATAVARVVGPDHVPLGGARLRFVVLDDELRVRYEELSELGLPSIRSGSDGRLEIPWARPDGFVALVVSHSRYADALLPYLPVGDTPLTLMVPEYGELRGRVYAPDGSGAAGTRIEVYAASGLMDRVFTTANSDAEGFYHVRLPIGSYRVRALHADFAAPPPPRADLPFKGSDALVDIMLESPSMLTGRVVDDAELGMAGIEVSYWMDGLPHQSTITSADGTYRLRVPTGEGTIHVVPPQGYMRDDPIDMIARMSTVTEASLSPVALRALPVIRGTVRDVDGDRVANAMIQAKNLNVPVWQLTDEHGDFEIRLGFEPQSREVLFSAEHPRRFQRADFEVSWRTGDPVAPQLARFEPNLADCDPENVLNSVDGLRGKPAPAWACTSWVQSPLRDDESGAPRLELADLSGKVIVLTFWGGFDNTGPGFNWMQWLNTLYAMFRDDDQVAFAAIHDGVSYEEEVVDFVHGFGVEYAVGIDGDHTTFDRYDTVGIPQTFLIDKHGVVRFYDVRGRLLELIKALRNEG